MKENLHLFICMVLTAVIIIAAILVRKIKDHTEQHRRLEEYLRLLRTTYSQIETLINEGRYFSISEIKQIKEKYSGTLSKLSRWKNILPDNDFASWKKLEKLNHLEDTFTEANQDFILKEKREKSAFFSVFDDSQADSIITDEDQLLVLSGAGSGKTKTIEGKVNYLINYKKIDPSEILLVSFTNATVNDLNSRDLHGAKAVTFHKIGLDILRKTMMTPPDIFDSNGKTNLIKKILVELNKDPNLIQKMTDYFLYDLIPPEKDDIDDQYILVEKEINKNGYLSYRSLLNTDSIKGLTGQRFKSKEEARIANFFTLHGIRFEYEKAYKYQGNDGEHNAYKPDFYLPDHDIYLEHFGITRDRKVPFTRGRKDQEEQEKKYIEGIKWKRQVHKHYKTTLLQTYSFYFTEGIIYDKLREMLLEHDIPIQDPKPDDLASLFERIVENQNTQLDSFTKLLATFITQFKSTGKCNSPLGFQELYKSNAANPPYRRERNTKFLFIANRVYDQYQNYLKINGQIDFEDMINKACLALRYDSNNSRLNEQYKAFKYIIIDEYQDISSQRMDLIRVILSKSHAKLFCVGDDWQSIYRFSGSDLSNILNFGKEFPDCKQMNLNYTYRFPQELSNAAAYFIRQNPQQIEKTIIAKKRLSKPINIIETFGDQFPYILRVFDEISTANDHASVYVLGRYNSDINNLERFFRLEKYGLCCKPTLDSQHNLISIKITRYPHLKINFSTIHRSKGLEADYVIVLNLSDEKHGFPSKIEDDPVISLVLPIKDQYPFEEERRLFYVALTRTRNKTFLLSNAEKASSFSYEIKDYPDVLFRPDITRKVQKPPKCPRCGRSLITKFNSNGNNFFACSGYPECIYINR